MTHYSAAQTEHLRRTEAMKENWPEVSAKEVSTWLEVSEATAQVYLDTVKER